MYLDEFTAAVERTKRMGLKCPNIDVSNVRFLSGDKLSHFPLALRNAVGLISHEELDAQCLYIHYKLLKPVSDILRSPAYFTIGHIETSDRLWFEQDEESLSRMLESGTPSPKLKIHAWLTLPSMEILDFSFLTSYAVIMKIKESSGGLIAEHADELKHGMMYHPMLIGDDFVKRVGVLVLPA